MKKPFLVLFRAPEQGPWPSLFRWKFAEQKPFAGIIPKQFNLMKIKYY